MLEDVRVVVAATSLAAMGASAREMFGNPPDLAAQTIRMWGARRPILRPAGSLSTGRGQGTPSGEGLRPTLIIGAGKVGRPTAKTARPSGDRPQADRVPDKDLMAEEADSLPMPILGASWDLDRVAAQHDVQQVIIMPSRAARGAPPTRRRAEELGPRSRSCRGSTRKSRASSQSSTWRYSIYLDAPGEPQGCSVRGQVRGRPRSCGRAVRSRFPSRRWLRVVVATIGRPLFFRQLRGNATGEHSRC